MLLLKLAAKNITHAGLRTWLNVIVLSFAFVAIVLTEGIYDGMSQQIRDAEIESNVGGGQFWLKNYDPYDPFTLESAHGLIPPGIQEVIFEGNAAAILIAPASIFPRNQVQSVQLKGISPGQKTLKLPTHLLADKERNWIPGFIGSRMSKSSGLNEGDYVSARWKNINGTFDAGEIRIVKVIDIAAPLADRGQIWVPLNRLQEMLKSPGQATIIVLNKNIAAGFESAGVWVFKNQEFLLKDLDKNVKRKKIYSTLLYIILVGLALLAVFDTQVLSIFKRRKEVGTLMALGMTRQSVISLFVIEGCLTGVLAFAAGILYGIPLFAFLQKNGIILPGMVQQSQFAIGLTLYPKYAPALFLSTALVLFLSILIVSFLPTSKIARLKPTEALRGKKT